MPSRIIFKGAAWWGRMGEAKTTVWHLNRLIDLDDLERWVFDQPRYIHPRAFLARKFSRFTRGFNRSITQQLNRLCIDIVATETG